MFENCWLVAREVNVGSWILKVTGHMPCTPSQPFYVYVSRAPENFYTCWDNTQFFFRSIFWANEFFRATTTKKTNSNIIVIIRMM